MAVAITFVNCISSKVLWLTVAMAAIALYNNSTARFYASSVLNLDEDIVLGL